MDGRTDDERNVMAKAKKRGSSLIFAEFHGFFKFEIELDLHIMVVNIVLKFQSPLQVIMVFVPIGYSKWSTAKIKIALKTYELHFRNILENH